MLHCRLGLATYLLVSPGRGQAAAGDMRCSIGVEVACRQRWLLVRRNLAELARKAKGQGTPRACRKFTAGNAVCCAAGCYT